MAWREWFQALDADGLAPSDPGNPAGDRVRVRLNLQHGQIVDFVVQYETPDPTSEHGHRIVPRSDGTHPPHDDRFDWSGKHATEWLDPAMTPREVVPFVIADVKARWEALRDAFLRGVP